MDQNKKVPQFVKFRCGRVYIKNSLKEVGVSYRLPSSLLKQELDHDEFYEDM